MKKIWILLCFMTMLSIVGCSQKKEVETVKKEETAKNQGATSVAETQEQTVEAKKTNTQTQAKINDRLIGKVFENQAAFYDTATQKEVYLKDYVSSGYLIPSDSDKNENVGNHVSQESEKVEMNRWCVADMDSDGNSELLIELSNTDILVLHRESDTVYGWEFPFRGMEQIKEDGTFISSGGAVVNFIEKLKFDGKNCSFIELCCMDMDEQDDSKRIYRINGKASTEKEVEEYFEKQEAKKDVLWKLKLSDRIDYTSVQMETYEQDNQTQYRYALYDSNGKTVYREEGLYKEPVAEKLENEIVKIVTSAGAGVNQVRYFDSRQGRVSELYENPRDESGTKLIRFETDKLIIQDMFQKKSYREIALDMYGTADPNNAVKKAGFTDENTVQVTYLKGPDAEEVTETFHV